MRIGTNLGVKSFQNDIEELKGKADFIELYLPKVEDISKLVSYREYIRAVHLPDLNDPIFEALEITNQLEANKAIVHFYTSPQGDFQTKIETLRKLCCKAEEYNIQLCLENTAENVRLMEILFNYVPELWFCLDIGHANLWRNNPVDFIEAFGSRLRHVHIHDNHGGFSEDSDLHLAPGEGNIDFQAIFKALDMILYSELLTFERTPWDDNQRIIRVIDKIKKMDKQRN